MKPTLEQRIRRIEEKVSSKKKVTEAVDRGDYSPGTLEKMQIEKHEIVMSKLAVLKKFISYYEREYRSIFLRYGAVVGAKEEGSVELFIYLLVDSNRKLNELASSIEDEFGEIEVYPVKGDLRYNLRIEFL